jgi:hypothetical protein
MGTIMDTVRTTLGRRGAAAASRPAEPRQVVVSHAERAECTCPEQCERDHEND